MSKYWCRQQYQRRKRWRKYSRCQRGDSLAARGEDHGDVGCSPTAHEG